MGEARRRAAAFAAELAAAWPGQAKAETIRAYATALEDVGLGIADDVSALLRVRTNFPPSVAQIYEAAREVRKETPSRWSTWDCVYGDGVVCANCTREYGSPDDPIIHGHQMVAGQMLTAPTSGGTSTASRTSSTARSGRSGATAGSSSRRTSTRRRSRSSSGTR